MLAAVLAALVVTGAGVLWIVTPSGSDLQARVQALAARNGVGVLAADQVPTVMAQAMVAIEDERFYSHHGPDTIGLARAAWVDLTQLCACQGGSTITQQLVNLTYYPDHGRIARKVPSMVVAFKVETKTSKRDILADYLTVIPSGRGLIGAQAAACTYFGHDLSKITLAEAAEIAGMPQAPSGYDPRYAPDSTLHRRAQVLSKMVELGYITPAAASAAQAEPVLAQRSGCV
jgi:membrane peptidoglycan carboxypeptidase